VAGRGVARYKLPPPMQFPERFAAGLLRQGARACALTAIEALARQRPGLVEVGLPATFADPVEDTRVRILTLAESLDVDRPELLAHQMAWYKVALAHRGVAPEYLPENLLAIRRALEGQLPIECHAALQRHVDVALQRLATAPTEIPSWLEGDGPLRDAARRFLLAVLENRRRDALDLVLELRKAGASVADLHDHVLSTAQREIGRMWLMGEIPIADEHFASRIVESCIDRLSTTIEPAPPRHRTVLMFAVGGDMHSIGLRMVADRFEAHGYDVWNLGADMPASDLDWLLADRKVDLIAIGATLALHVGTARSTIALLRAAPAETHAPILVGGGPFAVVPDLWRIVGADAVANEPEQAVRCAEKLLARGGGS
jgi:MerR family transcriptional regulator, light-induced transcriptional regulator